MEKREELIKVTCCHEGCKKPFHLRVELSSPDDKGEVETAVDCPYCREVVMVKLPVTSSDSTEIMRSVRSNAPKE